MLERCTETYATQRTGLGLVIVSCFKVAGHKGEHAGMLPASWVSWEATPISSLPNEPLTEPAK